MVILVHEWQERFDEQITVLAREKKRIQEIRNRKAENTREEKAQKPSLAVGANGGGVGKEGGRDSKMGCDTWRAGRWVDMSAWGGRDTSKKTLEDDWFDRQIPGFTGSAVRKTASVS